MQTLTIPASVTKRKQACKSCRQRKKKCDAERPTCSLCKKWGTKCQYATPASSQINATTSEGPTVEDPIPTQSALSYDFDFAQTGPLDFMQFPGMNLSFSNHRPPVHSERPIGYPTPESGNEFIQPDEILDLDQNALESMQLPPKRLLIELVELFFEHLYHMFPCFHKKSFLNKVQRGDMENKTPLLLYSICCITARYHPDDSVKKREKDWYEQARFSYELTRRCPDPALLTIQAVLLLVFHADTVGDFSASWLFLGKAWRQAVVLGLNHMDASHAADTGSERLYGVERSEGNTVVEKEEYRRALWLLFVMDRTRSWPTGWPNAITETQFKVDFPVADTLFQAMEPDSERSAYENTPFTRNFSRLVASSFSAKDPLNLFHYIAIAHVLLGRLAELIHSLHDATDTLEYAEECAELDAHIIRFRLSIPRQATSVLEALPADRGHVVWLNVILNNMAILLHYRCSKDVPMGDTASQFALAVTAARNVAQIIKDASRISIDLLLSAHISSSLYVAACILVIQWRTTQDESLKEDIDLFGLVFDRMDDVFSFLGFKFKLALDHDLKRSEADLTSLRERGVRGLLADCTRWRFIKEEVKRRGMDIDVS